MKFKCHQYTWEDIKELCAKLSKKIRDAGFKPDAIVAIARGGWVPARILCDFLNVKDLYSVKTEHWGMVATETGKARITHPLNVDFSGKNVLVVDDVADTGETVELVAEHVKGLNAMEVKIAVIDFKHTSKFEPDFFASEMKEWKWIVYPWSLREDVRDLIIKIGIKDVKKLKEILEKEYEFSVEESLIEDVLNDEWYVWNGR